MTIPHPARAARPELPAEPPAERGAESPGASLAAGSSVGPLRGLEDSLQLYVDEEVPVGFGTEDVLVRFGS